MVQEEIKDIENVKAKAKIFLDYCNLNLDIIDVFKLGILDKKIDLINVKTLASNIINKCDLSVILKEEGSNANHEISLELDKEINKLAKEIFDMVTKEMKESLPVKLKF